MNFKKIMDTDTFCIKDKNVLDAERNNNEVKVMFLMKGYDVKTSKNGKPFISGSLEMKGAINFTVWNNSEAFKVLSENELSATVCVAIATKSEFNGSTTLNLINVATIKDDSISPFDFVEMPTDKDKYTNAFKHLMYNNLSEDFFPVFTAIYSKYGKRFEEEYAARSMHDNIPNGLLRHTYKMLHIAMNTIYSGFYPNIANKLDKDLLLFSIFMHDLGKTEEYFAGYPTKNSFVSHRVFGIEMIMEYKDIIIEKKGRNFFDVVLAVISQHHGEYEENPKHIASLVVHLIDNLEAQLMIMETQLDADTDFIGLNDFTLSTRV